MSSPNNLNSVESVQEDMEATSCQTSVNPSRRGIFFDRDGVLNEVVMRGQIVGSPRSLSEFKPLPLVERVLHAASTKGSVVIITNQPDISSGRLHELELEKMHAQLHKLSSCIDLILWEGSNLAEHNRRKPSPLMLFEAAQNLCLNLSISWMIGDSDKDMKAGWLAGCRTVLLQTDYNQAIHGSGDININSHKELLAWLEKLPCLAKTV